MRKNYNSDRILAPRAESRNPPPIQEPKKTSLWPTIIVALLIAGGLMAWVYWRLP